jgi:hypothetical protein
MASVVYLPRNSSRKAISSGHGISKLPSGPLKVPQDLPAHTAPDDMFGEYTVTEYRAAGSVASDDHLPDVSPLPWRQCAVLMVLSSIAVYALGFLVVTAFNHLFQYFQL